MTTFHVTVEVEAGDREGALLALKVAGFNPLRVTVPRATPVTTTAPHPFVRASAVLDMPEGLDSDERNAYVRGYATACVAYHRKHGNPSPTYARANEWERHPDAHRKGLAELASYRLRTAAYLAARAARGVAA